MTKFVITWNTGYGESFQVIDADTQEEAAWEAYQMWRDEAESSADYAAYGGEEGSEKLEEKGEDPEDYGMKRSDPEGWDG
jgi:hypothetical protein